MNSGIFMNASSMALPTLECVTPPASPVRRKGDCVAENEPPALKRKRAPSISDDDVTFLTPLDTNFPFLDFSEDDDSSSCDISNNNNNDYTTAAAAATLRLPKIKLVPRMKKSRRARLPTFPQKLEHDLYQETNAELTLRRSSRPRRLTIPARTTSTTDNNDTTATPITIVPRINSLRRASSSRSIGGIPPRKPSLNMARSLSLQFNLSFLNLAAAATGSSIATSSGNSMPKRKSLLHIHCPSSSSQEDNNNEAGEEQQPTRRSRSPVAATLDYLATAIRFPDGGIGLSI